MNSLNIPEIQKLIKDLSLLGITQVLEVPCDNVYFYKGKKVWKCYRPYFLRESGMCMTHAFVKKGEGKSIICKWIPITNEMFYESFKQLILNSLNNE